jgi:hypothetical protein
MSADTTQETSQTTEETNNQSKGKDVLADRLAQVEEQLRSFNETIQAQNAALTASRKPAEPAEEDNLYDPNNLLAKAKDVFSQQLRER